MDIYCGLICQGTLETWYTNWGYIGVPNSEIKKINDIYLETLQPPFDFSFTPNGLENLQNNNELKIISYDTTYNSSETSVVFKVAQ